MANMLEDDMFAADDGFMSGLSEEELESAYTPVEEVKMEAPARVEGVTALDMSALALMPGVTVGKTGVSIDEEPLYAVNKLKFEVGHKTLVSILSDHVVILGTHYDQDLGKFICFGGQCCKDATQKASQRHVYPVLVYDTDENGSPISRKYEFMTMTVGYGAYKTLTKIQEQKGSLVGIDICFECTDEKYQKVNVNYAGAARWPQIEGCDKAMNEFWSKNMDKMLDCLGRKITEEEYIAEKKASNSVPFTSEPSMANVDFDSVFK